MTATDRKKTARLSGALYLTLGLMAFFGLMYVPGQIKVKGDFVATIQNMLEKESLFRVGIASHLSSQIVFIFLAIALYRLFENVDVNQSRVMFALILVQVPIVFIAESFNLTALMIAKGELNSLTDSPPSQLVIALMKMQSYSIQILQIFWGLWLLPFGSLVYRCGFIPKFVGILLIIGGVAYMIEGFVCVVQPEVRKMVSRFSLPAYAVAELFTIGWLLIKGTTSSQKMQTQ